MATDTYDILIIGGGQAGVPLAYTLAAQNCHVALVERKYLGGSCINYGCTPTKAVIASARVAHLARHADEYGVRIPAVSVDFPAVLDRAKRILKDSRTHLQKEFQDKGDPVLLRGHARFAGRNETGFVVRVGEQEVTAKQVVVNVGARTQIPPIEGLDQVDFLHAGNWLEHRELPAHLVVIGGGYIGLEMGQFYRRMGSRVTIVQRNAQVVPREDEDVGTTLQRLLEAEGITFRLQTSARRVVHQNGGLAVTVERDDGTDTLDASHVFLAAGRQPNTDDLGVDTIGLALSDDGFVLVDERLATSVEGVWAAGDVRNGPMFTHTAWDDHRVLASQLLGDGSRIVNRVVPYAVFTDPELGRAGMTEREAREAVANVDVARIDMKTNGKANEIGETDGFIKVVINADTDRILGASVLAAEGAELVHTYIDLMNAGAPYTVVRDAVHIHPTLSESVQSVLATIED